MSQSTGRSLQYSSLEYSKSQNFWCTLRVPREKSDLWKSFYQQSCASDDCGRATPPDTKKNNRPCATSTVPTVDICVWIGREAGASAAVVHRTWTVRMVCAPPCRLTRVRRDGRGDTMQWAALATSAPCTVQWPCTMALQQGPVATALRGAQCYLGTQ